MRELFVAAVGARDLGTNNIDHHRTADYTGLITALGERAGDSLLTMEQLFRPGSCWWETIDESEPLLGWQIRSGIRHFGTKLFPSMRNRSN